MKPRAPRSSTPLSGRPLALRVTRPLVDGAALGRYGASFVVAIVVLAGAAIHASYTLFAWLTACAGFALSILSARSRQKTSAQAHAGGALALASLGACERRWFAAVVAFGLWLCASAVLDATAEIEAPSSLASIRPPSWRAWRIGFSAAAAILFASLERTPALAVVAVALLALALFFAATLRAGTLRRLELGVPEKIRVLLVTTLAGVAVMILCMLADRASAAAVSTIATVAIALVYVPVAAATDAIRIGRQSRTFVSLAFSGAPLALLAYIAADDGHSAALAVACVAGALGIGALAPMLAASLRPAGGAWLEAVQTARSAIKHGGSDDAMRAALMALREPAKQSRTGAELLLLDPPRAISADAAGYMRTREEAVPVQLLDVAASEPEATLRAEVLDALEVRRPDLRSLGRWMEDRGALAVTVVSSGGEATALLVIPRGLRSDLVSLEEARAFKELADDFCGLCITRAALARGLAERVDAAAEIEKADARRELAEHALSVEGERHALATARLARPAAVGVYSAGSRMALDALENKAIANAPLAVVAPSGVDPIPLLARAHLAGPRSKAPFVIVECTSSREHDVEKWRDPKSSPLVLAHKGLLVLCDGAALPRDVQQAIGEALAERRSPAPTAEPLDVALAITSARPFAELAERGELDPLLASRFGAELSAAVTLPMLAERAEDLRALVTDLLAREGVRSRGHAVGIEDRAFAELVDYPFPGGDAELAAIVRRLVAMVGRDGVVRVEDMAALKLDFEAGKPEKDAKAPKIRAV